VPTSPASAESARTSSSELGDRGRADVAAGVAGDDLELGDRARADAAGVDLVDDDLELGDRARADVAGGREGLGPLEPCGAVGRLPAVESIVTARPTTSTILGAVERGFAAGIISVWPRPFIEHRAHGIAPLSIAPQSYRPGVARTTQKGSRRRLSLSALAYDGHGFNNPVHRSAAAESA
jgi:hypothetical protein